MKDRVKVRQLAHSLAGAAAKFGFAEAGDLARQLDLHYDADESRIVDMLKALDASVFRSQHMPAP
jgi:HPt (histidine-containing phosphotransfer) domain-containing protein